MSKPKTLEKFIEEVKEVWGDSISVSPDAKYVNNNTKISIICPKHGVFETNPKTFIKGHGCKKCADEAKHKNNLLTNEAVIKNLKEKLGDTYLLDKVEYYNARTKILLGCRKHGYFPIKYHDALNLHGCPICNQSRMELLIKVLLEKHEIPYIPQHSFEWMKTSGNGKLSLDFYLPEKNIAIECQGRQHFEPVTDFGGDEEFEKIKFRDALKKELCKEHGVKLVYYLLEKNNKYMKEDDVYFNNTNELLKIF